MADFRVFFHTLVQEEGGYVNNPADHGGPTKYGVTLKEWLQSGYDKNGDGKIDATDIQLLTADDAYMIAKKDYWDTIAGDQINNQSIANLVFDWGYVSGAHTAIKYLQRTLGFMGADADGIPGHHTIDATNSADQENLFNHLKANRETFFRAIVANNPSQQQFLHGWLNRNNSFTYTA